MSELRPGGRKATVLMMWVLATALVSAGCAGYAVPNRPWRGGFPYGWPLIVPVEVSPSDGRIADRSSGRVPRTSGACTGVVIRLPGVIVFHGDRGPVTANVETNLGPGEYSVRYRVQTQSLVIEPLDTKSVVVRVLLLPEDPLVPLFQAYLASMAAAVPLRVFGGDDIDISGCMDRCARVDALAPDRALELIAGGGSSSGGAATDVLEGQSWKAWVGVARKLAYHRSADDSLSGREVAELVSNHRVLTGMLAYQRPTTADIVQPRITTQEWQALEPWERALWHAYIKKYGSEPDISQERWNLAIDEDIALGMALRMVPQYVAPGLRDGFRQLIDDPLFIGSVIGAITVYFALLVAPEPFVTKATAALTTLGLISIVGFSAVEIVSVARAWVDLRDEARAARTMGELEAAAERFGRSLSGTAVRVLVAVFMAHATKVLPGRPVSVHGDGPLGPSGPPPAAVVMASGGTAAWTAAPAAELGWGIRIQDGIAVLVPMAMSAPGVTTLAAGGSPGSSSDIAATTDNGSGGHGTPARNSSTAKVPERLPPSFQTYPANSVWSKPPVVRGVEIERRLGGNLPPNFQTIDRWKDGVATSIKSIDLRAKTYQRPEALRSTIEKHIRQVSRYQGGSSHTGKIIIRSFQIKGRALDLVVPGPGTSIQQGVLQDMVHLGQSSGVRVNIIVLP